MLANRRQSRRSCAHPVLVPHDPTRITRRVPSISAASLIWRRSRACEPSSAAPKASATAWSWPGCTWLYEPQRRADVGVSEALLYELWGLAAGDHPRRRSVPQAVDADLRQPERPAVLAEPRRDLLRPDRLAGRPAEHPAVALPASAHRQPFLGCCSATPAALRPSSCRGRSCGTRRRLRGAPRRRSRRRSCADGGSSPCRLEVDVVPLAARAPHHADTRSRRGTATAGTTGRLDVGDEALRLVDRPRPRLRRCAPGRFFEPLRHVRRDEADSTASSSADGEHPDDVPAPTCRRGPG